MALAWKELRGVQKSSKDRREEHLIKLVEQCAEQRDTLKEVEIKKIHSCEKVRDTITRHKYYLKNRYGMIRSLMVQDYNVHKILAVIGVLALTTLLIPRIHKVDIEKISNGGDKSPGDNIENKWKNTR